MFIIVSTGRRDRVSAVPVHAHIQTVLYCTYIRAHMHAPPRQPPLQSGSILAQVPYSRFRCWRTGMCRPLDKVSTIPVGPAYHRRRVWDCRAKAVSIGLYTCARRVCMYIHVPKRANPPHRRLHSRWTARAKGAVSCRGGKGGELIGQLFRPRGGRLLHTHVCTITRGPVCTRRGLRLQLRPEYSMQARGLNSRWYLLAWLLSCMHACTHIRTEYAPCRSEDPRLGRGVHPVHELNTRTRRLPPVIRWCHAPGRAVGSR